MLISFFMILLGGSVATLYGGLRYKRWLLTMFSTIMSLVLAFQAYSIEVVSGGVTIVFQEIVIVLLMWMLAIGGFVFTLIGMVTAYKNRNDKQEQLPGRPVYAG